MDRQSSVKQRNKLVVVKIKLPRPPLTRLSKRRSISPLSLRRAECREQMRCPHTDIGNSHLNHPVNRGFPAGRPISQIRLRASRPEEPLTERPSQPELTPGLAMSNSFQAFPTCKQVAWVSQFKRLDQKRQRTPVPSSLRLNTIHAVKRWVQQQQTERGEVAKRAAIH